MAPNALASRAWDPMGGDGSGRREGANGRGQTGNLAKRFSAQDCHPLAQGFALRFAGYRRESVANPSNQATETVPTMPRSAWPGTSHHLS